MKKLINASGLSIDEQIAMHSEKAICKEKLSIVLPTPVPIPQPNNS